MRSLVYAGKKFKFENENYTTIRFKLNSSDLRKEGRKIDRNQTPRTKQTNATLTPTHPLAKIEALQESRTLSLGERRDEVDVGKCA